MEGNQNPMKVLNKTTRLAASVAAGALALAGALVSPVAANAAGSYYPSGPQTNVSLSTVTGGGWVLCWSQDYGTQGTTIANILAGTDAGSVSACSSTNLLLTGWAKSDPNTLPVLAAAPKDSILNETTNNGTTLSNGTYWYYTPGMSIGFSPNDNISQNSCDAGDTGWGHGGGQDKRLCWHFGGGATLDGGWSLGTHEWLNDSSDFTRAIFKQIPSIHKGIKVNAGALGRWLGVTRPANGSLSVSVSEGSSGACSVSGNVLYASGSGICSVTVTSLKANGDVKSTKTKDYLVN